MDPNENLREQRRLRELRLRKLRQPDGFDYVETVEEIARLSIAMDVWLSTGGFLPDAWKQKG